MNDYREDRKQGVQLTNLLTFPDSELSEDAQLIKSYFIKLIRSMPNNVYWLDQNGRVLGYNDNTLKFVGFKDHGAAFGKTYEDMAKAAGWIHGEEQAFKRDDLHVLTTGRPTVNVEEPTFYDALGQPVYYMTTRVPIFDEQENVIGILGISTDITERKQLEEKLALALKEQEAAKNTLQQLINAIPASVYWQDQKGVFLGRNLTAAQVTYAMGYDSTTSIDSIIGKTNADYWPEYAKDLDQANQAVIETGRAIAKEDVFYTKERELLYFYSTKAPLKNQDGQVTGVIGISVDITERKHLEEELRQAKEKAEKLVQEMEAFHQTALQVVHDIRSPLSALNTYLKDLPQIPEEKRILMRSAANRINDIANNLLQKHRGEGAQALEEMRRVWLLAPLVESIISEKRAQFAGWALELDSEISSAGFAAFARFDAIEMKRLLSNLINNASEAFDGSGGKITVFLDADEQHLFLTVRDNGCGIPEDKLALVLEPGVSLKAKGNGLGLPHAKKTVEEWGGSLMLSSILGEGTAVTLNLVRSPTPSWFVSSIEVIEERPIAILDDDASVHDAWDQRLREVSGGLQIHHFRTSQDFIVWYQAQGEPIQVFSDYELLGDALTGLDVLERLGCGSNSILVTSHYENPNIIERCQKQGVRLLPKNLLAHVVISAQKTASGGQKASVTPLEGLFAALQKEKWIQTPPAASNEKEESDSGEKTRPIDAVFIDDDPYNHEFWQWSAKKAKKQLFCFTDLASFEAIEETLPKSTAIYIDLNLANKVRGLDVAKTLHDRGFLNLHIATGYADFKKADYPFLVSVMDKTPPF